MSYVKNLQNQNKQQKSKAYNNVFKYILSGITLFVVFLIIAVFAMLILDGFGEVSNSDSTSWTEVLFGKDFDMNGNLAMGIIAINTVWMSILVLLVTTPISVCTALFITRVLKGGSRNFMIAIVSILAAIPSVIYGSFGKYFILKLLMTLGITDSATDATLLSVVIIVSIMVMPTITLMSITSLMMVDRKMEDSSEALGATKIQTSIFVTLRSAKTGIIIGMLFALGRCLGEATAISMLSGARPITEGTTFNLFEVSLFMSPVIMSAFVSATTYPGAAFTYIVLSSILLMVIILLFSMVKWIESKTDDEKNSKKHSKKAIQINNILKKVNREGQDSLSGNEVGIYRSYLIRKNSTEYYGSKETLIRNNSYSSITSRTSIEPSRKFASYKKKKTGIYKSVIILLSLFGVISLISILGFLFDTNLSLLFNWDYLTSTGRTGDYYGLGMAMFGTIMNIIIVLSIALPLGIAIAVYTNSYLNRESYLSKIVSFCFQIMTSIPAVIYGALATIIFVNEGWIRTNAFALAPMLMLVLVILPTIIKQTQEGFRNVKNSQVEGSLALGATQSYSSRRIVIVQALPAILSAAILGISIVMADSAIMITIINKPGTPASGEMWMQEGGYTLSTLIYWLSSGANAGEISRSAALEQMKVIGILLMILIFWLTIISQKIKGKNNHDALIMFIGIFLFASSFFMFGGSKIMLGFGIAFGIIGAFYSAVVRRIK